MHTIAFLVALSVASLFSAPASAAQTLVEASSLLGAVVLDTQGERLGTVSDLAVDVERGAVPYAIVEYDDPGALRVELRPVAVAELRPALAPGHLVFDPGAAAGGSAEPRAGARLLRASTLLGMPIEQPGGADYGVIVDLGVDLQSARVRHALVRRDAGPGEPPLREVPVSALRFEAGAGKALLTPRPE